MRKPWRRLRTHLQAAKATNELHLFFLRAGVVCLVIGALAGAAYASSHTGKQAKALQTHAGSSATASLSAFGGTVENGGQHRSAQAPQTISYTELTSALRAHQVTSATMRPAVHRVQVKLTSGKQAVAYFPPALEQQLTNEMTAGGVSLTVASTAPGSSLHAGYVVMICLSVVVLFVLLMAWMNRNGRPAAATGRNQNRQMLRVRDAANGVPEVRFADVAGCDEAVEEVREMVDFLSNPVHYSQVGARMPAGIVLYGPPGTGKTLLAKAVAGESGVPFFAMSGSEFVEMYVGVGASRVRDLFQKARAHAPSVVFIDEIDAVGRKRGGHGGGHQEQETTLNEILVQLDGFNGRENVVVIAATNRLDTLDEALLRPGRLTRHVHVGLPAEKGRLEILRVHSRSKPIGADVDLPALAASTAGSSGAQLAEMLNEGAIMAARERAQVIGHAHLWEGFLRVVAGPRKAHATLAAGERETIAYHEAGHVLCAELCPTCDPTLHATINPRGRAAGFAVIAQSDRALQNEQFIHEQLIYILGGRAAEYLVNATVSSGAANDLEKANSIARQAVEQLGLSRLLGQVISGERGLSQEMSAVADREVRRLVDEAYVDAVNLIQEHREQLERLSEALINSGDIDRREIVAAMHGAVAAPRQPRQPMRVPSSEPANIPATIDPSLPDGRWRHRIRGSLAGEIAGAVATSVADIVSRRRARREETDGQALTGI
jgi:cell division protease FtsH